MLFECLRNSLDFVSGLFYILFLLSWLTPSFVCTNKMSIIKEKKIMAETLFDKVWPVLANRTPGQSMTIKIDTASRSVINSITTYFTPILNRALDSQRCSRTRLQFIILSAPRRLLYRQYLILLAQQKTARSTLRRVYDHAKGQI